MAHIVLIDNQDSFVYNLVDAVAQLGHDVSTFRNTVPVSKVLTLAPDLIIGSPGPGHPRGAGNLMEIVSASLERQLPYLGICLGFQALLEHYAGSVEPCGPEHGKTVPMTLTPQGQKHPVFLGLTTDIDPLESNRAGKLVPVARYHSLGCLDTPEELVALAETTTEVGNVCMAAETQNKKALGLQYHPESILTPGGPLMLQRCVDYLLDQ